MLDWDTLLCVYILTKLSDDEDEAAELMRELEKIKKERLEQKEKEVCSLKLSHDLANTKQERERAAEEEEQREVDIARGNPLLNSQDFNMKRRWDDDVVFKNQARGTENRDGKEFVNVGNSLVLLWILTVKLIVLLGPPSFRFPQALHGMHWTCQLPSTSSNDIIGQVRALDDLRGLLRIPL